MWFKNLTVFRLDTSWNMSAQELSQKLEAKRFIPAMSTQAVATGWVPPRENYDSYAYSCNGCLLITMRREKKLLPPKVVAEFVKEVVRKIEENEGRKPGRKEMREIKENVTQELMSKAFAIKDDIQAYIDPKGGWLVINAGSAASADLIVNGLQDAVSGMPLSFLQLETSPGVAMTNWLLEPDDVPAAFTVDHEAELKAKDESKAAVKFTRTTPEIEEAKKHIAQGRMCSKLAMTWSSKVSFLLTEKFEIKRLKPLEVAQESADDVDAFDGDLALMTGEVRGLLNDFVECLGELKDEGQAFNPEE